MYNSKIMFIVNNIKFKNYNQRVIIFTLNFIDLNSLQMQPLSLLRVLQTQASIPIPTSRQLYTSWRNAYENMFAWA